MNSNDDDDVNKGHDKGHNVLIIDFEKTLLTDKYMEIIDHIGKLELLKLEKTAFLCSRKIPASIVLKCYDWAIAQREQGKCIISGFHSKIEKDVLHYLLKGDQPIIIAMARGLKQRIEPELKGELEKGRLLIVTPFEKEVKRITTETAMIRNQLMIELAENLTVGFISKGGNLERLLKQTKKAIKLIE
jgi:hypothetical protein